MKIYVSTDWDNKGSAGAEKRPQPNGWGLIRINAAFGYNIT